MKINLANWDRALRFAFGFLLVVWSIAGGPWWGLFGFALLATAAFRICPVYAWLRMSSARPTKTEKESKSR